MVDFSKHNPNFEFQVVFIQTLASFGNPNAVGVKTANGYELQRRKFGYRSTDLQQWLQEQTVGGKNV